MVVSHVCIWIRVFASLYTQIQLIAILCSLLDIHLICQSHLFYLNGKRQCVSIKRRYMIVIMYKLPLLRSTLHSLVVHYPHTTPCHKFLDDDLYQFLNILDGIKSYLSEDHPRMHSPITAEQRRSMHA
jgi:hypothetical protein